MKKTYALKRLLEHGPMGASEIAECTGWGYRASWSCLCRLLRAGAVKRVNDGRFGWRYEVNA